MSLSENGERVAFLAAENTIYRDGTLLRKYGSQSDVSFPLSLSADGTVLAWKVRKGRSDSTVVTNGVEGRTYAMIGQPVVSEDGSVVAYRATASDDEWFIVANGKTVSDPFDNVSDPAISRDGKTLAFATEGKGTFLFLGGKKITISESVGSVFVSPDGREWGYTTRSAVVTERGRSEEFEEVHGPEFSPDGGRVAFSARRGKQWFVVIGDLKVESPGLVAGPFWSADGRRVGYGALLGREIWWKVIDVRKG